LLARDYASHPWILEPSAVLKAAYQLSKITNSARCQGSEYGDMLTRDETVCCHQAVFRAIKEI